ncbi:MAG: MBL fold metallo-hydrolase [Clostridia bacterium]|nr:MBL fold metallo-hydrolase [Clostridia bacterium]
MLNFCSLYSGSSGNSLFVQSENTKILIDCGVSCKKVQEALNALDVDPTSIDAVLITHEHSDHVKGLGTFSKKFDVPIFANQETLDNMEAQTSKILDKNIHKFKVTDKFNIGDLEINPFSISHDAANPCGFNIFKDNKKISIATDIGTMDVKTVKHLEDSIFVLLESNYDPDILKCSPYPYLLKRRIAGPAGHLPNKEAGKTISHLMNSGLQCAMLGHLSKENNFPELAYKTVAEELIANNQSENAISLSVASRTEPGKLIEF